MSGWVKIHRTLLEHPAFRNETEAMAFAWLIVRASWADTRVRYKGHSIALRRGQLAISQRDMAAAFDRDKGWIERLFRRLRSEAMIEATDEAGVSVITICNYDKYQGLDSEREAGSEAVDEAAHEAEARQARGTEQRREEEKKDLSPRKGGKRLIPDDWLPLEFGSGTQARRIVQSWSALELERQIERFRAYHIGQGSKFVDWQQAWATWVLNSVRFASQGAGEPRTRTGSGNSFVDMVLEEHDRAPRRQR